MTSSRSYQVLKAPTIIWFRKALRLHDNPALLEAIRVASHLYPLFILDPYYMNPNKIGVNRFRFMLECMKDLDESLRKRYSSQLLVLYGEPTQILKEYSKKWNIQYLCFEKDTDIYSRERDKRVQLEMTALGVKCLVKSGNTLYDLDWLIAKVHNNIPTNMNSFLKLVTDVGPPPLPADSPSSLPSFDRSCFENTAVFPVPDIHEIPGYEEIAKQEENKCPFIGGEQIALQQLQRCLERQNGQWATTFSKPWTSPLEWHPPSTTTLSPYIKCGALSVRYFYHKLKQLEQNCNRTPTKPPVSLVGQLYWREHFYLLGYTFPNFDRIQGNPLCKPIPWECCEQRYKAWEQGLTGYPFIDAAMTQLKQWGWLHHLARHAVACFLTRGDLWISWEKGKETFERYLIDADWSINAANWMWLSCSAFFTRYLRVYSPVTFPKKYDKEGEYVRHFVPVLKNMPAAYIYEPWKAPVSIQQAANCIIGKDYPFPIVNHDEERKRNIQKMALVFQKKNNSDNSV